MDADNHDSLVLPTEPLSDETLVRIGVELTAFCRNRHDTTGTQAAIAFENLVEVLGFRRRSRQRQLRPVA